MKKIMILTFLFMVLKGWSQTNNDPYLHNPSLGGIEGLVNLGTSYRTEMTSYDLHPKTISFWGSSGFNNPNIAAGCRISQYEGGVLKNTNGEATFIYRLPLGSNRLSFGLSGTFNKESLIKDKVKVISKTDPILFGMESEITYNANVGVSLSSIALDDNNSYFVGLSAYDIVPNENKFGVSVLKNKTSPTFIVSGMYNLSVFNGNFSWDNRGAIIKNDDISFDFMSRMIYQKQVFIGAGYCPGTVKASFGFNVQNLGFEYIGGFGDKNWHQIIVKLKILYSKESKSKR